MLNYFTPKNQEELFDALGQMTEFSKIVAGSTDLGIHLHKNTLDLDALLYLGYIDDTRVITEKDDYIEIGANLTHTEIENSNLIKKYLTSLADASADVGSLQIRNNGTIGGNVGNASPAGDLIPVLFMLDAEVIIACADRTFKTVSIKNFILSPGKTALKIGEAIYKFRIKKRENFYSAFVKLGSRKKLTISRIGLAISFISHNSKIKVSEIWVGAISLKPVKLVDAENLINDNTFEALDSDEIKDAVYKIMSDQIFELTPEKFDRDYKMWASRAIVYDTFELIYKRIKK